MQREPTESGAIESWTVSERAGGLAQCGIRSRRTDACLTSGVDKFYLAMNARKWHLQRDFVSFPNSLGSPAIGISRTTGVRASSHSNRGIVTRGFSALVPIPKVEGRKSAGWRTAAPSVLAHESTLGSLLSVALSSAQASNRFRHQRVVRQMLPRRPGFVVAAHAPSPSSPRIPETPRQRRKPLPIRHT